MNARVAAAMLLAGCASPELVLNARDKSLAQAVVADVDGARVLATVSAIVDAHKADAPIDCATLDEPSDVVCHDTHLAARAWLAEAFASLGYPVSRQTSHDGVLEVVNVVAELPGSGSGVLVVGAHYDAAYAAANDDSSGVAVLVELARVLRGRSFERTVRFVGFDLEELGAVGSASYARSLDRAEVAAMISLDGVGISTPTQPSLPGVPFPSKGDFLAVIANEPSVELGASVRVLSRELQLGPTEVLVAAGDGSAPLLGVYGVGSGDRSPFWVLGIPAILLCDTQPIRTQRYHSPEDDVAGLDPEFLARSARIAAATVAYAAGAPR